MINQPKTTSTSKGILIAAIVTLVFVMGSCAIIGILGNLLNKNKIANTSVTKIEPTPTVITRDDVAEENFDELINIPNLVLKSTSKIEEFFGKPETSKKITDKSSDLFDTEKEFNTKIKNIPVSALIRFKNEKAIQFILNLPSSSGNKTDVDFVKRFGFDLDNLAVEEYTVLTNWTGESKGINYEKISVMKISGDYYSNLTVIIKSEK